jgi:hypothetical protein
MSEANWKETCSLAANEDVLKISGRASGLTLSGTKIQKASKQV